MKEYSVSDLKNFLMEGVPPIEVSKMPLSWIAEKYTIIVADTIIGRFSEEVFFEPACTFGQYVVRLKEGLKNKAGVDVISFEGLNDEDWKTVMKIVKEKEETIPERKPTLDSAAAKNPCPTLARRILKKITFKPLHSKKFRCNQTGAIVKAAQTRSYANRHAMSLG